MRRGRAPRAGRGAARRLRTPSSSRRTAKGGTDFDRIEADTIVISVGASPRILPTAVPDGERILTWTQLYDLPHVPEHLIVVGSGVTGAEFASAYRALGAKVTLISSRDQVLPGEDADAARVIENVFKRNGMKVLRTSRAPSRSCARRRRRRHAHRRPHRRGQPLPHGRRLDPEHRGHRPRGGRRAAHRERAHPGQPRRAHVDAEHLRRRRLHRLPAARLGRVDAGPHRRVPRDGRRRRTRPSCATSPRTSSPSPRSPRSAGPRSRSRRASRRATIYKLPLASNPRAKMMGIKDGFVKLFASHAAPARSSAA